MLKYIESHAAIRWHLQGFKPFSGVAGIAGTCIELDWCILETRLLEFSKKLIEN